MEVDEFVVLSLISEYDDEDDIVDDDAQPSVVECAPEGLQRMFVVSAYPFEEDDEDDESGGDATDRDVWDG